ncbi:MAG: branched-chain-amino-acid transaminase [Candidatus Nezhaarchaeota archaeon]|nr:branched-chain-amino-acid transaminase [Candidatus Nezhaarchaeota archaeon]
MREGGKRLVYIDGKLYPASEAKISVYDHGLLYGDGVFEGVRVYDGLVFKLREHVDRIYESAKVIKLDIPMTREEMVKAVVEVLRANKIKDGYVRIVVTRGVGDLGLDPRKCPKPTVIIIADRIQIYSQEAKERGLRAIISSVRRDAVDATSHEAKTLNYLNSILAKIEAIEAGVDEAIMLDHRGFVSEGTGDNVFIVKKGVVSTPPRTAGILSGVTRSCVIELCRELGIPVFERDITVVELYTADEVFVTGTAAEVMPVTVVSGRVIGDGRPGPVTKRLMEEFRRLTRDPRSGVLVNYD